MKGMMISTIWRINNERDGQPLTRTRARTYTRTHKIQTLKFNQCHCFVVGPETNTKKPTTNRNEDSKRNTPNKRAEMKRHDDVDDEDKDEE